MRLALQFWSRLAIWTGVLFIVLLTVTLLTSDDGPASVLTTLPVWAGLALVLGAFPAGIGVSGRVLSETDLAVRPIGEMMVAAVTVSVVMLVLVGFVGPTVVREVQSNGPGVGAPIDPDRLSFPELIREGRAAVQHAESAQDDEPNRWLRANIVVWHYARRWAGVVQPLLFAWLGVLTGFWSRWSPRHDVAQVQHWAMGLFLVMSTYLAGENSFELIVLQATGPVFFAGFFVLIVPSILLVGLAWPTAVALWKQRAEGNGVWRG